MDIRQYLGKPWLAGADGPDAYDCMSFARMIQERHFGISMPRIVAPDYKDGVAFLRDICGQEDWTSSWVKVPAPAHGDLVVIRKPIHLGVWIKNDGGGTLHCAMGHGVIFTPDAAWRVSGFGRRDFYRHASGGV